MNRPEDMRIGLGHDTHRLADGRPLILGGVPIESPRGPVAHSDGDVLLHALIDALLGAAGLGDIGDWFPDNDPVWQGAASAELLAATWAELQRRGWRLVNLDCTVFAERPKLSAQKPAIQEKLAELLSIAREQINVKAKSGEQVGPVGRGEAIAASAVVLLSRAES